MSAIVALPYSHAPWHPHKSGYHDDVVPNEHDISKQACEGLAALLLRDKGIGVVDAYAMPNRFCCVQPCAAKRCRQYNAGLRWVTKRSAQAKLAVQFHIDSVGDHRSRGALCLTNGGYYADMFAMEFLAELERRSGIKRRTDRSLSVFDLSNPQERPLFGGKWFLDFGADNAVIVELGNVDNRSDQAWLTLNGVADTIQAAYLAMTRVWPGLTKE